MCGIGGILRVTLPGEDFVPIPDAWADALDESIKHRGPDGCGRFRDTATREDGSVVEVVLVHRRLSIIDHEGGAQPMVSESGPDGMGRVAVVFNGCLYNHRELRKELEKRGHVFESDHSDTEVWVHWWRGYKRLFHTDNPFDSATGLLWDEFEGNGELWYHTAGDQPDGMYALAIWDGGSGHVVLIQDEHQEKPLYSFTVGDTTIFGSSANGVSTVGASVREKPGIFVAHRLADWICMGFNTRNAVEYGMRCIHTYEMYPKSEKKPRTPRDRIRDVGEVGVGIGCILMILGISFGLVWLTAFTIQKTLGLFPPAVEIGIYLAALAAVFLVLFALFIGKNDDLVDTSRQIRGLPPHPAPKRSKYDIEAEQYCEKLITAAVRLRLEADVPVGCFLSGGIDSSLIAKFAHEADPTIKTFCMRMPDERYDESVYAQQIADTVGCEHHTLDVSPEPAKDLMHLITELGLPFGDSSILPTYWLCKAAREHVKVALSGDGGDELFVGYERMIAARWLRYTYALGPLSWLMLGSLRRKDRKGITDKAARFLEAGRDSGYTDLVAIFPTCERSKLLGDAVGNLCRTHMFGGLSEAVWFDRYTYLPGDLLRKVDTASMSVGLEVRCPFLSRELWNEITPMPAARLAPRGRRKAVLREIAYQYFPKDLVDRPKQGFSIPVGEWFRTDFGGMRTLLHEKLDRPRPFGAAHDVLDFNMDYVRSIISEHMDNRRDHSQRLFMLTSLAIWSDSLEN